MIDRFFSKLPFDEKVSKVKTTDGFEMQVVTNDLIGRHIYLTGEFDRTTVEVLLSLSRPGDVLLDIGANIGYVSGCFLKNVAQSKVIAVDPQPRIVDLLRTNLEPFGHDRFEVFPVGLSEIDGNGFMEIREANLGASCLVKSSNGKTVPVALWSAERLFSQIEANSIDLVKIDVEGHEETVIRSCSITFERLRPRAIFFEDHTHSAAADGAIGSILDRIGYRVFGIKKRLTKLDMVPLFNRGDCIYNDYLAVPKEQLMRC